MLQNMAENGQRLHIPPQQGIHTLLNEHHLRMFEPPFLEKPVTIGPSAPPRRTTTQVGHLEEPPHGAPN